MTTLHDNQVAGAYVVEKDGEIVFARQVVFLDGVTGAALTDPLSDSNVPPAGDPLNSDNPEVVIEERVTSVESTDESGSRIRIELIYRRQREEQQEQVLPTRGGSSVVMTNTKYDRDGNPITVDHPNGEAVTASINVPEPRGHFVRETIEQTNNPDEIVNEWVNKINSADFREAGDARQWLCTNVDYELVKRNVGGEGGNEHKYRFSFEFERRTDEHRYDVWWTDETGRIPDDADSQPDAHKEIDWHEEKDFTTKFPMPA